MTPAPTPAAHRVVLAYSGGLDTSVAVRWMTEEWGVDVIALAVDVGQHVDGGWDALRARAVAAGAVEALVVDARAEFASDYCLRALRANALYEGKYPLVSALSRPVIAKHLVTVAAEHGADAVAHGCTGKGNDQVRFEVSVRALAPELDVLAPVRTWGFTREDSIDYAARFGIPVSVRRDNPYSIDENLWGRAIECGVIEDPWAAPPSEPYTLTTDPTQAPTEPWGVVVSFESGVPVALDGDRLVPHELITRVTELVGRYGWGRLDMVENRRVGIKSREVYECPGALALILAHADLESITLERDLQREKARLEPRYAGSSTTASGTRRSAKPSTPSSTPPSAPSPATFASASNPDAASSSDVAPPTASTTTTSPPTTPPTSSATRTPPASSASGASASRPSPAARAHPRTRRDRAQPTPLARPARRPARLRPPRVHREPHRRPTPRRRRPHRLGAPTSAVSDEPGS